MAFRAELSDFAAFYERTYPRAFRTAVAIVRDGDRAAELTQQAYVQAFRDRDRFRGDVPAEAWLHRIVVNVALSSLRRRRGPETGPVRWIDPASGMVGDDTVVGTPSGDRIDILRALEGLEPRHRAAVVLRYYHDYDYATIARVMGAPVGTVGSWLSRGLERLALTLALPLADLGPSEPEVADAT